MRSPLALLALMLFPAPVLAQFGVSSIDDPIRPDRTPLAAAEEVPSVLLLGLGGTSPLFVNPARAARSRDRFVFGTLQQPNAPGTPVSFTGLFGTRDHRWLVTVENSIASRDDTDAAHQTLRDVSENVTFTTTQENALDATRTATSTRARALLVGRTDFGGYAFGLYGGYRTHRDVYARTSLSEQEIERRLDLSVLTQTSAQTREDTRRIDRDDVGAGVEMALAGRTWDLAAAVSYQHRAAEASIADVRHRIDDSVENFDAGGSIVQGDREERLNRQALDGSPSAVDFEVIGALRAGLSRDDYLFGSVAGTFGGGDAEYALDSSFDRYTFVEVNGETTDESTQRESLDDAAEIDLAMRATQVSLGYVYARTGRSLTVLAGINPTAAFGRVESALADPTGSLTTSKQETDRTTLALNLPLYARFDVTRRLEVFGGGVYSYAYDRTELTERPLYPADLLETDQTLEISRERASDTFSSNSRLFAGAQMTFRSGLTAQAAFHGDLAAFRSWTVSLGYRF